MLSSITTRAIILILGFMLLTFAFVIALYALTADTDRQNLLHSMIAAVPPILAAIPAIIAMLFAKDARSASQSADTALNGTLDARIKSATKAALKDHATEVDTATGEGVRSTE